MEIFDAWQIRGSKIMAGIAGAFQIKIEYIVI